MKRYFGLFVVVAMLVMALGCQMPGMPGSNGWNTSQGWTGPALTANQAGVLFSVPSSNGSRSVNITSAWASTYANLYQLYVYSTDGTVLHSVPVSSGSISLAINMTADSADYKIVVVAGRTPNTANVSGYPAYLLGAGTTSATLTKGQVTPIYVTLNTTDIQVPSATSAQTGQVLNGTITGSFGIQEIGLRPGEMATQGFIGTNSIANPVQFSLTHSDTTTGAFTGNFSVTMPTSLATDPSTVNLWFSSNCVQLSESTSNGGFANVNYMLADGVTGWVLPTTWEWHQSWFVPSGFTTTTPITVTYGATQVTGTIGWK